ncbi:probable serine/threonine-protein kinase MARK-A isoform X1 [Etheostoma spectabile]|uniref:probable serine/threonine-protein kinase MARK-A isoform X1 n=2 Tax=Etheostoma spectabile TaxID=54343 RepID=UPI0013AF30D1|nr:probable serine/threonine-protein kinase MARK-A isoform X1 [Etheostoma spectabile]XP_032374302.1 probable serine/threonine-protein kinase MARK-A isoform X1 [Etheostoma spectabile]
MAYSTSTIAQGCFGKVYKQKYNDTWAAVKKVPHNLISKKDLERECEVYNKAKHPNIVKLLGNIILQDGKWIIPLEFIFGEDLETTIFKTSKSKIQLTPSIRGTIITGMCEGLLHLHSKDVVHQDLKPENIMVEHNTNRAVIIDLGLAKFFRFGLSSAVDMGNEAYSAPEVLQRGKQRDQRSDVWAMGKIIAELCARVRLYTPTVCPAKIKETLLDQPYCHAVCRMVETDPTMRASMGGVISEIRSLGIVPSSPVQKDHLKPPAPQTNVRNFTPSPMNRAPSPFNRDPSPMNRAPSPFNRDPAPINRAPSPFNRDPAPINRAPSPFNRDPAPINRAPSPFNRDPAPINRAPSPFNRDPAPINRAPSPFNRDPAPMNKAPLPLNRDPSPLKWERSPRPDFKALNPQAAMHLTPSPQRTEDRNKHQALVPAGRAELTEDFTKMKLFQEAAKDLPCNLPTTGRVVIRHFEEKNGEVETWEQKEVVTRDGKIVQFNDIKFNSK